jgi:methylmalonyl-CoA carboxyltransferase small subunit
VKLKITIDNKTYEVDVEAAESEAPAAAAPRPKRVETGTVRAPAAVKQAAAPQDATPVNEDKVCRSPVSGIVVRTVAQAGQTLQKDDVLLVLEAMKMETSVTAPVAGTVAAIKVKAGDSVQSGQVLVEFQ